MLNNLDLKVRQIHFALDNLKTSDLTSVVVKQANTTDSFYTFVDFNEGIDEAQLANVTTLLVNNIACIKDHLKIWCERNNAKFEGESVINTNKSVAIIHDLWNLNKHSELNRPPRSGSKPQLRDLRRSLRLSTGAYAGSSVSFMVDPRTGQMTTHVSNGGSVELAVNAKLVDENGTNLGDFETVCLEAIQAWRDELVKSGVPMP